MTGAHHQPARAGIPERVNKCEALLVLNVEPLGRWANYNTTTKGAQLLHSLCVTAYEQRESSLNNQSSAKPSVERVVPAASSLPSDVFLASKIVKMGSLSP